MKIKVLASGSSGNCYYISDGETSLLLDAGIPIKQIRIALDFKTADICAALVSHEHMDHCKAVPDLLKYTSVKVIAPSEVFTKLKIKAPKAEVAEPLCKYQVNSMEIMPFDCEHDVTNFGYLIRSKRTGEKLLYYTDSYYLKYTFRDIDYLLGECNYDIASINTSIDSGRIPYGLKKRLLHSHMSIDTFIELLIANGYIATDGKPKLKQIYLLHLSDNNSNAEEFKKRVAKLTACEVYIA